MELITIGIILAFVFIFLWLSLRNYQKENERYIDNRGYMRNGFGRLVHRDIAYKQLYSYPDKHPERFGSYDIHHNYNSQYYPSFRFLL